MTFFFCESNVSLAFILVEFSTVGTRRGYLTSSEGGEGFVLFNHKEFSEIREIW